MTLPDRQPRRRLLFLLPFPPRMDAAHGGGKATAQLLMHLAARHQIGVLYLRAAEEPPIDDSVAERCELVEEVKRPSREYAGRHARFKRLYRVVELLGGTPLWVGDWAVAEYAERVRALARTWQPDIIQVEFHVMAQYLPALDACPAPRVLTEHEPGAKAARDLRRFRLAPGRLFPYLEMRAWERYERSIMRQVH